MGLKNQTKGVKNTHKAYIESTLMYMKEIFLLCSKFQFKGRSKPFHHTLNWAIESSCQDTGDF